MRIVIRARPFTVTPAMRAYTERRLLSALDRFDGPVTDAVARFGDLNGPRGGDDKVCRLEARLRHGGRLAVEEVHRDLYAAIDRASDRLGRSVARTLARRREMTAGSPRQRRRPGSVRGVQPPEPEPGAREFVDEKRR